MTKLPSLLHHLVQHAGTLLMLLGDAIGFLGLCLRAPTALAAANLFLRKQLALYQERKSKPRRATHGTRLALVWLARWFYWRQALAIVQPQTFSWVASPGVSSVLVLAVEAWTATNALGPASAHPPYGL